MKCIFVILTALFLLVCSSLASAQNSNDSDSRLFLSVFVDGTYHRKQWDKGVLQSTTPVSLEEVRALAIAAGAPDNPPNVILSCASETRFRAIKAIMDALANEGVWSISLVNEP